MIYDFNSKTYINSYHLVYKTYTEIMEHFLTQKEIILTFQKLLKAGTKEEKVYTFIPLLHLSNTGRVNLHQDEHLGEIHITAGEHAHEPMEGVTKGE